jgi:Uma2 family endonuclease
MSRESPEGELAMATDAQVVESFPPPGWHSDALKFYEVVDGRIVENPPMGAKESVLASYLQGLMDPIARSNRLGRVVTETLFVIDRVRKLKRRPDLAFVSSRRWPLRRPVPRTEGWDVIPDLTVEVVSESNTADAVAIKIDEYFQAGVSVVWVIYPVNNRVYVYDSPTRVRILQVGDTLEGGDLLPGFQIALSTLFEDGDGEPEPTN